MASSPGGKLSWKTSPHNHHCAGFSGRGHRALLDVPLLYGDDLVLGLCEPGRLRTRWGTVLSSERINSAGRGIRLLKEGGGMMKRDRLRWVTFGVMIVSVVLAPSAWAQTTPPIQNGQVEIHSALPRTAAGTVDVEALKQTIQAQFARPGVQEVQFRNVSLTEAEQRALFLNSDPNKNLLRQVSTVVPSANGAERNVTFRSNDLRARVGREEGQLRARIEGIDHSQLTESERQNLQAQFDRFRLEGGTDRGGNRTDGRGGRSGNGNSGSGSGNSGHGSDNSGPGSANSGSGGGGRDDFRNVNNGRREDRREDRRIDRREDRREDRQLDRQADRREDRQLDRRADRQEDRREDRRSNAGGELRGLDRADQVAGDRGQQGRDNARAAQMDRPNRVERAERPQRPERPERPQRPERPERPERPGHN